MANDAIQFQHWLMNAIETSIRNNLDHAVNMLSKSKPHIIVSVMFAKFGPYMADRGEYLLDMARRNRALSTDFVLKLLDGDIMACTHLPMSTSSLPFKAQELRRRSCYARRARQYLSTITTALSSSLSKAKL
jgi:hypothetical protein